MTYNELCEAILNAQDEMLKHKIEANSVTLNGRRYGKLIEHCPPNMKPTIFGMTCKVDYAMPDDYDFLVQYEPPHPKTNADRIRSMTDEELAERLVDHIDCDLCPVQKEFSVFINGCKRTLLDWLKEEFSIPDNKPKVEIKIDGREVVEQMMKVGKEETENE